ncbi:mucin-5AC-like [Pempheris klunzingeri]|uniref:mucin-5AC-like n=1 Tax=Pempheris klunzingeri TaxID=3127111 RepID=UPI0039812F27
MSMCSTASPACANGGYAKTVADVGHVSLRAETKRGPGHVSTHSQEPRQRPFSTVFTSNVSPRCHQRRWSADLRKGGTSSAIIVKKNKKEPQAPQRSESLLRPHTASHPSFKRLSCPPIGVSRSSSNPPSSSSSSSTSSCSSPPPVPTSVITGRDPLGWKLRPKSGSTSPRARSNRLSLQIPLPVVFPDPTYGNIANPQSDNAPNPDLSPKTKLTPGPKPSCRRHSDSSAFLRSLATPLPAVTLEELSAVHLRPVTLSDEADDVFGEGGEEGMKATARPRKTPPPVPEKTSMAQQIAQVISQTRQRCGNDENIYTSVIKPKRKDSHQTEEHSSLRVRKTAGLRVDTSCDGERSTPRFPG